MKASLFEGWTRDKQCFGLFNNNGNRRFCAIGWLKEMELQGVCSFDERVDTVQRIDPKLLERFPEIPEGARGHVILSGGKKYSCGSAIWANDILKLDPEIFLSLDREAIAEEEKAREDAQAGIGADRLLDQVASGS